MYFLYLWLQIKDFHWNVIARKSTILWMPTHLPYWYHEYVYTNTVYLYWSTFYVEESLYIHLTMPTCLYYCVSRISVFLQHWRNRDIHYLYHLRTHCGRLTLSWHSLWYWHVVWSAPSHFLNKCRFMIWYILISESVSVYGRYVVGLLSVWVRDCRSAVGYDSTIVLMIGFQSVSCRLSM